MRHSSYANFAARYNTKLSVRLSVRWSIDSYHFNCCILTKLTVFSDMRYLVSISYHTDNRQGKFSIKCTCTVYSFINIHYAEVARAVVCANIYVNKIAF